MQDQRPLQEQFPGEDVKKELLLQWAIKARKRIIRDIQEKIDLKFKNKKLREQLKGRDIQVKKIKSQINDYEQTDRSRFFSNLFKCIFRAKDNV